MAQPFKRQLHKMVKHTQTIHRLTADEFFKCVDHFVGLAPKGSIQTLPQKKLMNQSKEIKEN